MIANIEQTSPDDLSGFDVAIIGSGFAGIETALTLAHKGLRILLAESGRERIEAIYQDLLTLDVSGRPLAGRQNFNTHLDDPLSEAGRIRAFGGTSAIWSGRWKRLSIADFCEKTWVPFSGWPIGEKDIRPYYSSVERDYGLPDFDRFSDEVGGVARDGIAPVFRFDQKKKPTRLAETAFRRLRKHPNILVVLGATATEIVMTPALTSVDGIAVSALDGTRRTLKARVYVLASGGIEIPRLMLASNRQIAVGIGNQNDQLGRYYMDHPKMRIGELRLRRANRYMRPGGRRPRFSVGLALSEGAQTENRILNHSLYLTHPLKPPRPPSPLRRVMGRLRRKLVGVEAIRPTLYLEQAPNPDSRITLASRTDALGMRGVMLDWRFTEIDRVSVHKFVAKIAEFAERTGIGSFHFHPEEISLDALSNANHPMGTTRMSDDPRRGVVDANCRVFGISNLYVAGSSVFATAGNANPTYTIVCLARRLGDHIAGAFNSASPAAVTDSLASNKNNLS